VKLPKNNRIFIALFFCGIIIPTAILAFLSFRNVQSERLLAEKNFEDAQTSFSKQAIQTVRDEQTEILKETRTASQFLYEQPQKLLESETPLHSKTFKASTQSFCSTRAASSSRAFLSIQNPPSSTRRPRSQVPSKKNCSEPKFRAAVPTRSNTRDLHF
jgi:hypothetical protein